MRRHKALRMQRGVRVLMLVLLVLTAASDVPAPCQPVKGTFEAEFVRSVYVNSASAELIARFRPSFNCADAAPLALIAAVDGASYSINLTAAAPIARVHVAVPARDGEFRVSIQPTAASAHAGWCANSGLLRFLRCYRLARPAPPQPTRPLAAEAGRLMLFVDDFWVAEASALRRAVEPATYVRVSNDSFNTKRLHPKQHLVADLKLRGDELAFGLATAYAPDTTVDSSYRCSANVKSTDRWTCQDEPKAAPPAAASGVTCVTSAPDRPPFSKSAVRFYDPAKDGSAVNLSEVTVFFSGYENASWGDINVTRMSSFPVWNRLDSSGKLEALLLTPRPLTVAADGCDLVSCCDMATCESPHFANDNFGGSWLSAGGTKLHYVQSRSMPRFPPFTISWSIACLPESGQTRTSSDPSACHHDIAWLWTTMDGVRWVGTPWGESGVDQAGQAWIGGADGHAAGPDGADTMLYDSSSIWAEADRGSANGKNDAVAPALRLAYMSIFDKNSQQMWLDIGFSRDGVAFDRVQNAVAGGKTITEDDDSGSIDGGGSQSPAWPPTSTRKFWAPLGK
eukprot:SAG11_NODE_1399_length_5020_cov_3.398293_4_plen_567_part_00